MATDDSTPSDGADPHAEGEVLDVREVLSAIPFDRADADVLGLYLAFRTIGGSTVVMVDPDGVATAAPVQIATLAGITGLTLQQLLNANLDVTS